MSISIEVNGPWIFDDSSMYRHVRSLKRTDCIIEQDENGVSIAVFRRSFAVSPTTDATATSSTIQLKSSLLEELVVLLLLLLGGRRGSFTTEVSSTEGKVGHGTAGGVVSLDSMKDNEDGD